MITTSKIQLSPNIGFQPISTRLLVLLMFVGCINWVDAQNNKCRGKVISGKVISNSIGLEGVVVTDGFNTTLTDKKGKYSLICNDLSEFVYISTPSGYLAEVKDGVVQFFHDLRRDNKGRNYNFYLDRVPDDINHSFIAMADVQVLREIEIPMLDKAVKDIQEMVAKNPDYTYLHILDCGDIIFDKPELYPEYINSISKAQIPVYRIIGNHDLEYNRKSNERSAKFFNNYFGPEYYSFNRGEIHYVVLNNVFYTGREFYYIGYLAGQQLDWLSKDLSYLKPGATVVVAVHIPTTYPGENFKTLDYNKMASSQVNNKALYNLLEPFKTHIVSGHNHTLSNMVITDSLMEHNIAAISGSWWQMSVCPDGTPSGYTVFEVEGNKVTWRYKPIGLNFSEQFHVYEQGKDTANPEHIIANIWNWDPLWKVEWIMDGQNMGIMEQYTGYDPLIIHLLSDKSKLIHKWTSPEKTNHLFRAKPKESWTQIEIIVTDRFGNVYKKSVANDKQ